jgi:hypothetical protein
MGDKMIQRSRIKIFGGVHYFYECSSRSRKDLEAEAAYHKRLGEKYRIVKQGDAYSLYTRRQT